MYNFGVVEIATAKTTSAPGWAYVPDTRELPAANALPANRKRARSGTLGGGVSSGEVSARQEARIQKDIQALERDMGGKESTIPVPTRVGKAQSKPTPGVRKILQSQKTFANHLDDFNAMQSQAETISGANASSSNIGGSKRPARRDKGTAVAVGASASAGAGANTPARTYEHQDRNTTTRATTASDNHADAIIGMILESASKLAPQPGDGNPLLMSRVPEMPTEEELRALLAHAPLTYEEARGRWDEDGEGEAGSAGPAGDGNRPGRTFCEICGYWGRVRCMKCGTRVCALECLETHRAECITRYGL